MLRHASTPDGRHLAKMADIALAYRASKLTFRAGLSRASPPAAGDTRHFSRLLTSGTLHDAKA